ncbi:AsmA family protein [Phyllobacterium myrsinacearum]|uniref:Uncharacterized protein involved in outer membrane biogenesis n=1 Tax=Phyllobacterium myrsinacearum TaxID=28101 RepID=A0A839EIR0_9HYPH|nr:uncharacterized protein involved in outer membrane biogenesis [Phyllobacterium myrsinacearum]
MRKNGVETLARLFVLIGGLLVLVLTAALVVPYFVDWAGYRSSFEREASALLGRPVTVAGTASARLLPFPSVTFSDVKVGDAGSDPVMTIDKFSMDAELAPFLRGEILIFDMRLEKPTAKVSIDKNGVVDWAIRPQTSFGTAQVKLENMKISDGSVVVRDASTATVRTINDLDATLSATKLSGPWKFDGTLLFNGERTAVSASTGEVKTDGSLNLHARVTPDGIPAVLETDGGISIDKGALKYAGNISVRSVDETAPKTGNTTKNPAADEKPLLSSVRVTGRFEADHGRINIPDFRMEQGTADDPYIVNGNALFDYGKNPRFEIKADGQQVTFSDQNEDTKGSQPKPHTAAQRLGVFRRLMDQLPIPTVPGTIDLKLPAIVAGDTTIRSVTIDAEPSDGEWKINQLRAELPGRTQFEANGMLQIGEDFGFDGKLLLASRQPSGLAAWLTDTVDESIRRLPGAGFSGDVKLHDDLQRIDNLEVALGGASLKGSLIRSAKGESVPLTQLTLEGGALDGDALEAFAAIFGRNAPSVADKGAPQLAGEDLDVRLKAGPVSHGGLVAESLDTGFRLRDGVFDIDRLTVGNLSGATITATGKIEPFKAEPAGSLDATILSDDLAPFVSALAKRFPDFPFIAALNEHAAKFPGLFEDTQLSILANALHGGNATDELSISASGKTGGTNVTLSGTTSQGADKLRVLELTMNGRTDHGENLMALMGLPALPLGLAGELEADLALKGDGKDGIQTQLSLKAPDGQALLDGSLRSTNGVLNGEGRASIKASDLEPYLATAGYSLPGFGNGMHVDVASSFQLAKGRLVLPDFSGKVSDTKIAGRLDLGADGTVPDVQGNLTLGKLDLPSVVQFMLGTSAIDASGAKSWPKETFAHAPLFPVAFNLKLKADEVDAGVLGPVTKLQSTASLKDGYLRLDDTQGEVLGGNFKGMFELRNTSGNGLATGQFTLEQASLDDLYTPDDHEPLLGTAKIAASVNASGTSISDMMASVAGSGVVSVEDLAIDAINPGALRPILADADGLAGPITADAVSGVIGKYLHAGPFNAGAAEFAFTIAGGTARTSTFQLKSEGATLNADLRLNFPDMTMASQGRFSFDPGKLIVAGAEPVVEFSGEGPWRAPKWTLNRQPLEQFLTQRTLEREQQRVETMQASLVEKQRLRRESLLYQSRATERQKLAEEVKLKAEQEAAARAEAERQAVEKAVAEKAAEEAARKAREQQSPSGGGAQAQPPTNGAINQQSVDDFLKTLEPKIQ